MRHPVTIDAVERIMRVLGYSWRGEWQYEAAKALCEQNEVVIQGSRQVFGKDFTVGIYEAARITAGNTVTIALPTMTQATRQLGETIIRNVNRIGEQMEKATGSKWWKKSREQTTYQRWALASDLKQEGKLYVLSANEISSHVPEGYTTDDLDFNESHRNTEKILGIFSPFNLVARQVDNAKTVYMGVGGHKTSLIEVMKLQEGVTVVRWPASAIAHVAPEWIPTFEYYKQKLPPWQYKSHFECEQSSEGMLLMFPEGIPGEIDIVPYIARGMKPIHYFGIDLGKVNDATIVKVITVINGPDGPIVNEIDEYVIPASGISYMQQARMVYEWINGRYYWRRENIILELSGVGEAVYDIFNEGPLHGLRGIYTSTDLKKQFWHGMSRMIREGRFGCKWEKCRNEYEAMTYENVFRNGKYEIDFEHTDYWMALCMAFGGLSEIEAL